MRPVAARARRIALIEASVPDEVMRSISTPGTRRPTSSARSTSADVGAPKLVPRCAASVTAAMISGCAWPAISGPQEHTQSMYGFSSTSKISPPEPRCMNSGSRPIERIARTGEFTPPGRTSRARA